MSIFGQRKMLKNLAALREELSSLLALPMPGTPVRQITVVNPKGGGNTTTSAVTLAHYLAESAGRPVLLCDFNPNKGTARSRVINYPLGGARSVFDLGANHRNIHRPNDLALYIEQVGRLGVLHNDGVYPELVQQMTSEQYTGVLRVLKEHAQVVVVDTGNAIADPAMMSALAATDHLVFGCLAEVDSMFKALEGAADLQRMGYGDLVSNATAIVGHRNPGIPPSYVTTGLDWFTTNCRGVISVPYDPALRGGGLIDFRELRPGTENAFLTASLEQAWQFSRWPRTVPQALQDNRSPDLSWDHR